MLTNAQNKYIRSLSQQKYRDEHKAFVAEGDKIAKEWLNSDWNIHKIIALQEWINENDAAISKHREAEVIIVEEYQLQAISGLQTPNKVLLELQYPPEKSVENIDDWCIALDKIQDPGNMGTIIRIADWFGIKHILASEDSVDFFNPKVVQSAMGGHLRVALHSGNLSDFLLNTSLPVLAATLDGENIYNMSRPDKAIILIGNESKGLSADLLSKVTKKIKIPGKGGAESLNAAVSAGIICAVLMQG
ncbi:MAG: RNA methyltransferase [Bacteroidetes bacterium]|nr:RNA methyltransferase [Bacteroidota bacterium]